MPVNQPFWKLRQGDYNLNLGSIKRYTHTYIVYNVCMAEMAHRLRTQPLRHNEPWVGHFISKS